MLGVPKEEGAGATGGGTSANATTEPPPYGVGLSALPDPHVPGTDLADALGLSDANALLCVSLTVVEQSRPGRFGWVALFEGDK